MAITELARATAVFKIALIGRAPRIRPHGCACLRRWLLWDNFCREAGRNFSAEIVSWRATPDDCFVRGLIFRPHALRSCWVLWRLSRCRTDSRGATRRG